ncbi:MAG: RluA family pseudouridine synthase [Bdellovibrionales bacterium]
MTTKTMKTTNESTARTRGDKAEGIVQTDEAGIRLDRWFKRHFPQITHGQLQKWLRTGQVRLDGKRCESSARLEEGQKLRLPPQLFSDPALTKQEKAGKKPVRNEGKLKSLILYEDDDVVAINKPAGLAVQGGTGLKENLDDSLMVFSRDGETRPKLVHRLDRETSGVLLIARNDFAASRLTAAFRERTTQKIYWALTSGVPNPPEGRIDAPLLKKGQIMAVADPQDERENDSAKRALSLYQVLDSLPGQAAFVALWPLTGRTHQLRVHMAHIGTPIWGDPLYQTTDEAPIDLSNLNLGSGLHLHARQLIIPHPRKGMIDVTAPLGPRLQQTWRALGFSEKAKSDFDTL